jgi:hypothetical protein
MIIYDSSENSREGHEAELQGLKDLLALLLPIPYFMSLCQLQTLAGHHSEEDLR